MMTWCGVEVVSSNRIDVHRFGPVVVTDELCRNSSELKFPIPVKTRTPMIPPKRRFKTVFFVAMFNTTAIPEKKRYTNTFAMINMKLMLDSNELSFKEASHSVDRSILAFSVN